jgi:protein-tyrosine phosphatase
MSATPWRAPDESAEDEPTSEHPAVRPAFRVLAVCTGNICRSPALERLLRMSYGPMGRVDVASAGTRAVVDSPINAPMAHLLEAAGADTSGFFARQLTPELVRSADLVVGFTRAHRSAAVKMVPAAVRRSFTFLELARMLDHVDPDEVDQHVGAVAAPGDRLAAAIPLAMRHRSPTERPEDDDVEDPYGRSSHVFERVFEQIRTRSRPYVSVALR